VEGWSREDVLALSFYLDSELSCFNDKWAFLRLTREAVLKQFLIPACQARQLAPEALDRPLLEAALGAWSEFRTQALSAPPSRREEVSKPPPKYQAR
jgi:hypothetical protein